MTQAVWDPWVEINTETATKLGHPPGRRHQGDLAARRDRGAGVPLGVDPSAGRGDPDRPSLRALPRAAEVRAGALGRDEPDGAAAGDGRGGVRRAPRSCRSSVTLAKTGARRPLAILQATHDQDDRELARHVDLKTARARGAARASRRAHELPTHVPGAAVPGTTAGACRSTSTPASAARRAWWPARRRTTCPIVGKAEAAYGRQVHWLRIERWAEGRAEPSAQRVPADVLPALRGRAVRAGLPGVRRLPHGGRAQRAGLQPLRRHAVLRQQLPVSRAPLQLVELRGPGAAGRPAQPGRHRPPARRHGEVHDVHPAHRGRQGPRARREAAGPRRRHPDGLPADVPDAAPSPSAT